MRPLYFAYGSNLLDSEIRRHARDAEAVGPAFLPDYRLVFTKHSLSRRCDAASIESQDSEVVWGYLYRVSDEDRDALRQRERGYREVDVKVWPKTLSGGAGEPIDAFTFVAEERCLSRCGANAAYLTLIIEGARSRGLPEEHIEKIGEG